MAKVRRRLFPIIDRSLQYKFLAMIFSYGLITVLVLAVSLFLPDIISLADKDLSIEMHGAAARRTLFLHARVWPAIIGVICVFAIHSFWIFLRIFGPLYRFRMVFRQIGEGYLNFRVKFRAKDYLVKEREAFNKMMDVLAEKWGSMQSISQNALNSLDALEQSVKEVSDWHKKQQELLKTHRQYLENMIKEARYFRLSPEEEKEAASKQA